MLKRFTKSGKKQNKSGVILVTILFILAVAFILIGSALIMTAKTRNRLYTFAEGGQARITCTAAAQLFENALQEQQITDAQFKDLCTGNVTIWFTDPQIPGMGGDHSGYVTPSPGDPTPAMPDNCTRAVFSVNGTKYVVRFTTRIDTEIENVMLTYEKGSSTTNSSPFAFQVELGEGGELDKIKIGHTIGGGRYDAEDNLIVSRGNGAVSNDSSEFYSTFITTKPMRSASGTHYHGDLVYAGADAGVLTNGTNTGSGANMQGTGNVYFINCNHAIYGSGTTNESFTGNNNSSVVFCNVGDGNFGGQGFTGFQNSTIYRLSSSGSGASLSYGAGSAGVTINGGNAGLVNTTATTPPGAAPATGKSLGDYIGDLDTYINTEHVDDEGNTRPSCYVEFASTAGLPENGMTPAGATALPANAGGGTYKITGPTTISTQYHIDVSSANAFVYISGKLTISGPDAGFVVEGGTGAADSYRCYFILTRGASIEIVGNDSSPCGFFSANCHSSSLNDTVNQTQAPLTYIIGAGTNSTSFPNGQFYCSGNQGAVVEAMVALYAYSDGTDGVHPNTNDAGAFITYQGPTCRFYGRLIAKTVRNQLGGHLEIPYCPQFSSGENDDMLYRAKSIYTCTSFDYYYDDADHTSHMLHS